MADILSTISTRRTSQTERADPTQVKNNAGGYVFKIGDDAKIHRFLTLGTEGGTYYQSNAQLTADMAPTVLAAARTRGEWLVERVLEVSLAGRAPKQNPTIFTLAAVAGLGDDAGRKAALAAVPKVCRIGTHVFLFARYVEQFRGWGRGLRSAVARWYTSQEVDALAYQVTKYRSREGMSHRDLLRLSHPHTEAHQALFKWITSGELTDGVPALVRAHVEAMNSTDPKVWTRLIAEHPIAWEMLPDAALTDGSVWRALIEQGMPPTALLRNLSRFSRLKILTGSTLTSVVAQLTDGDKLAKGRVHPVSLLIGMKTYASGGGWRSDKTWPVNAKVVDALDAAYYLAYGHVEPAGKRTLVALDISGSMGSPIGDTNLSCREASAAIALVTLATEPDTEVVGFTSTSPGNIWGSNWHENTALTPIPLSPRQRLDDAVASIARLPMGGTDCALPMVWAKQNKREFETFVVLTDNETWAGNIQPMQALREYREYSGIPARLVVVGMTATDFSIADPTDPGSLDVAGFDSAVPNLIADFSRGSL